MTYGKGVVDDLCGYPQRARPVPAPLDDEWSDLAAADAAARAWCADVYAQVHVTRRCAPAFGYQHAAPNRAAGLAMSPSPKGVWPTP
jgi:hypothetical protein